MLNPVGHNKKPSCAKSLPESENDAKITYNMGYRHAILNAVSTTVLINTNTFREKLVYHKDVSDTLLLIALVDTIKKIFISELNNPIAVA